MPQRNWLILTALKMEADAIASELGTSAIIGTNPTPLNVPGLHLQLIGIGAKLLTPNVFQQFDRIILAGLGGALDPQLEIGDVVIDSNSAAGVPTGGASAAKFRLGKIYPSDHLITTVAEKQQLFEQTHCIAVDMESRVVRKHCEAAGIDLLHIRAVSDRADEALPDRISTWIDDVGEPKMSRVTTDLMFHPNYLPLLMRLQTNSRLALRNLRAALRRIVEPNA
jgi:hypothetical protein